MENIMNLELWLNETFGPSSSITELDAATEELAPAIDFALRALPDHDVGTTDGCFPPTEVSTESIPPVDDSGDTLRTRPSSGEMTFVKRRYHAPWIYFN